VIAIGHGGNGTGMHLTAQLFNHMAGIDTTLVPYRGTGPATQDLLAGHIPLAITRPPDRSFPHPIESDQSAGGDDEAEV
jgi:tripartite-type tricarboxylate transporter receptor subunit TctC